MGLKVAWLGEYENSGYMRSLKSMAGDHIVQQSCPSDEKWDTVALFNVDSIEI